MRQPVQKRYQEGTVQTDVLRDVSFSMRRRRNDGDRRQFGSGKVRCCIC